MYRIDMVRRPFHLLVSITLILSVFLMGVRQAEANDVCKNVTEVRHSDDLYGEALAPGETAYFEVTLPSPGTLIVDATVSSDSPVEVKLGYFPCGRALASDDGLVVIRQSVSAMLLKVGSASTFVFMVAAQDAESELDSYRIRTSFVDQYVVPTGQDWDGDRDNDPQIDGARYSVLNSLEPRFQLSELCRNQDEDADGTFFCATPVTTDHNAVAELRNSMYEDVDVYTFTLARQRTVRIETRGKTDTVGGLYDDRGHRLAFDDDGGDGENFRLVKTLGPGEYVVRVAGHHGAEGFYRLVIDALEW